jgi:succinate dehydrogenase / fumarate reductase flavoprotein subunit
VYRLAELSVNIIDQCVAQGVPFVREYGGLLDSRSFGGAQVSRTFYARGQTGQQLMLGAYSALSRQIGLGTVKMFPRHEMLDLVTVDGKACGIVTRDLLSGDIRSYSGHTVLLCTGGYVNVYNLSTNGNASNATAIWRAYKKGALIANPCYTQIHPTCLPVTGDHQSKLTLMSESLRNDGRVWVPKKAGDSHAPGHIPESERDYFLERIYPAFGNLVPRDVASRAAKKLCDSGFGVGTSKMAVYLDFADAIKRLGKSAIEERYGNLFQMYAKITGENPYESPMRIYPAPHYAMGGLWVDYNLMSTVPGLFVLGEANFSDHGANRLGASALMQGLADGYFVIPYTVGDYLAPLLGKPQPDTTHAAFKDAEKEVRTRIDKFLSIKGKRTVYEFHRSLGRLMWDNCGMSRNAAGLNKSLDDIREMKDDYWRDITIMGSGSDINQTLEKAGRIADYFELADVMVRDALNRNESCGGHFREEYQTAENDTRRDDENYAYVAAWEYAGENEAPKLNKEILNFESVKLTQRSYK